MAWLEKRGARKVLAAALVGFNYWDNNRGPSIRITMEERVKDEECRTGFRVGATYYLGLTMGEVQNFIVLAIGWLMDFDNEAQRSLERSPAETAKLLRALADKIEKGDKWPPLTP